MSKYHKIQSLYKRDPETKYRTFLIGDYSIPEFAYLANNMWSFTEKVDGTNIRVMIGDGEVRFGGRTDNAQLPVPLFEWLQNVFVPMSGKLNDMFPSGATLYGEGYGAKIQKGGGNYRPDQAFVLFDVKVGDVWLDRINVLNISEGLRIEVVPIVGTGNLDKLVDFVSNGGFTSQWGSFQAEGIVARPAHELLTRTGHRIITKLKTRDFVFAQR